MTGPVARSDRASEAAPKRRARWAAHLGRYPAGRTNSIIDVQGVRVGHVTVSNGRDTFTGATAVVIDDVTPISPARAGMFVGNGHGKFIGATQIAELGELETPIVLTSTLAAFRAADAIVTWVLQYCDVRSINPVVGEINDSWLSTADPRSVTTDHVFAAIQGASSDSFAGGNVGGGTGACALGFKGGIGSASRIVSAGGNITVGALVQANMSGQLRLHGALVLPDDFGLPAAGPESDTGSCMIVVAVDAPYQADLLRRVTARAVYALARVGAGFSHGSGDYAIAVSTARSTRTIEPTSAEMSRLFEATMDTVEEAVLDALASANTTRSSIGRTAHALPHTAIPRSDSRDIDS